MSTKRKPLTRDTIDPERYYSSFELFDNKILPWIRSRNTLTEILTSPRGIELFKPVLKVTRRYNIKGENILNVLALADQGKLEL